MSEKKDDGGAAFPGSADTAEGHQMREYGMSLRDWFAGMAMQGVASANHLPTESNIRIAAKFSYQYADAMIEARKQ